MRFIATPPPPRLPGISPDAVRSLKPHDEASKTADLAS